MKKWGNGRLRHMEVKAMTDTRCCVTWQLRRFRHRWQKKNQIWKKIWYNKVVTGVGELVGPALDTQGLFVSSSALWGYSSIRSIFLNCWLTVVVGVSKKNLFQRGSIFGSGTRKGRMTVSWFDFIFHPFPSISLSLLPRFSQRFVKNYQSKHVRLLPASKGSSLPEISDSFLAPDRSWPVRWTHANMFNLKCEEWGHVFLVAPSPVVVKKIFVLDNLYNQRVQGVQLNWMFRGGEGRGGQLKRCLEKNDSGGWV